MKITIHHGGGCFEWDSSMVDDQVEVNQIARDISNGIPKDKILRRYVDRNQHAMDYECPVCAANEKTNVSTEQTGLFDEEEQG